MAETVATLARAMRENGVRRIRTEEGLEIELDHFAGGGRLVNLEAFEETTPRNARAVEEQAGGGRIAPPASPFDGVDGVGACACGHSWLEHNEVGCLRGCSERTCNSSDAVEPEAAK